MNWPTSFYSVEFFWKLSYFLFSSLSLFIVAWYRMDSIVLIEILPFFVFKKKFITTEITNLFELFWLNSISTTLLFALPFLVFQLLYFFKSGWYDYQFVFIKYFFQRFLFICSVVIFFIYYKILPNILFFFVGLEDSFNWNKGTLIFETQLNILFYVTWIVEFHYFTNFWSLVLFCYFYNLFVITNLMCNYKSIKIYRRNILFSFTLFSFIILPPELIFQLVIFCSLYLITDFVFLFFCFKLTNNLKINANSSSIIKKTSS
uniref:SecY-independent transporter protein n=1 Tax=Pterocladiella media TaxID=1911541 RepID=A0A1D8X7Q5_9FLOR|nr:SecY-independent transporter protein [Pterocladiella media]AOX49050.1 SecY-independent transporter protein [Pterocladiella media]